MPRSHTITGTYSFEVEIALTATFSPGYAQRGPSYASGGEPAEPAWVEDLDITDIGALSGVWQVSGTKWTTTSILGGVDRKSEAYRRIVENILAVVGETASDEMLDAEDVA